MEYLSFWILKAWNEEYDNCIWIGQWQVVHEFPLTHILGFTIVATSPYFQVIFSPVYTDIFHQEESE